MEAYKAWVRRNSQWLSSMESLANTLTWFLPERFAKSELAPEALSTVVGLVTVMNQHIIATGPRHPNSSSPSLVAAVEETFPWPLLLSVVKETEVLVEMGAEYYLGRDHKWTPVATVETIKVLMRLLVLHKSGYKMLIDGGETPNVGDQPDGLQFDPALGRGRIGTAPSTSRPDRAMQAMLKYRANVGESTRPSWIVGHSSTVPPHTSNPWEMKTRPHTNKALVVGEVLLILRPLLYVLLIRRYGLRSWLPWLLSLALDATGMTVLYSTTVLPSYKVGNHLRPAATMSKLEKNELLRRQVLWALYLMRSPFFDCYTRQRLDNVEQILKPVPLFGTLAGKGVDLVLGIQAFYMYTAAS